MLNRPHRILLRLEEVLYAYTIKRHSLGKYYFVANAKLLQLVIDLLYTNKNKLQGNALLFSTWGCARDPMLHDFVLNLEPKSSRVLGCHFVLGVYFLFVCSFLMSFLPFN